MPKVGEITIRRLLAAHADPVSIDSWLFRGVEPDTIHERLDRVESDLQTVSELLDHYGRSSCVNIPRSGTDPRRRSLRT